MRSEEPDEPGARDGAPPSCPEDLALARAVLAGAPDARRRFVERMRCVPRILTAKAARAGLRLSPEDVEDLTQDVLVTLLRRLDSYLGLSSLEAFAYRFCQNVLSNHLRTGGRRARHGAKGEAPPEPATGQGPDHGDVYRALERVSPRLAAIVRMKHFDDLTFEAIGTKLSLSPTTVKTQYRRALDRLRELLDASRQEADR